MRVHTTHEFRPSPTMKSLITKFVLITSILVLQVVAPGGRFICHNCGYQAQTDQELDGHQDEMHRESIYYH